MKKSLTKKESDALAMVSRGADVYDYAIALTLRKLEKRGLVTITRAMYSPNGKNAQPYFGAIAKKASK